MSVIKHIYLHVKHNEFRMYELNQKTGVLKMKTSWIAERKEANLSKDSKAIQKVHCKMATAIYQYLEASPMYTNEAYGYRSRGYISNLSIGELYVEFLESFHQHCIIKVSITTNDGRGCLEYKGFFPDSVEDFDKRIKNIIAKTVKSAK